jgi:hypothetical protein
MKKLANINIFFVFMFFSLIPFREAVYLIAEGQVSVPDHQVVVHVSGSHLIPAVAEIDEVKFAYDFGAYPVEPFSGITGVRIVIDVVHHLDKPCVAGFRAVQ